MQMGQKATFASKWLPLVDHLVGHRSRPGGTLIPSCLAVLRLTTSQNLLACSIGRSPGFTPRTILAA
jgi:hypothetical protein